MSKERAVIEKTLKELEENLTASNNDIKGLHARRGDHSPMLIASVYKFRDALDLQIRLLRAILKEADSGE